MSDYEDLRTWSQRLLRGEKVHLRGLHESDLDILTGWWNETADQVFQQDRIVQHSPAAVRQLFESWSANNSPSGVGYAIADGDDQLVGHITLWGLALPERIATCALIVGPSSRRKGYGRDAIRIAFRLAFEEMGANKVELRTWAYNEPALRLYSDVGFVEEGRRRAATYHRSGFHDEVLLGILKNEYTASLPEESAD